MVTLVFSLSTSLKSSTPALFKPILDCIDGNIVILLADFNGIKFFIVMTTRQTFV